MRCLAAVVAMGQEAVGKSHLNNAMGNGETADKPAMSTVLEGLVAQLQAHLTAHQDFTSPNVR